MLKKLYLVRHAESEQSAQNIYQHPDANLSDAGKLQAEALARRFVLIPIDAIYTSPFKRALQTAEFIETVTQAPITQQELVREVHRPSEFLGQKLGDVEPLRIKKIMEEHRNDPAWHYSDEENFFDLQKRLTEFAGILGQATASHVLLVSHAVVIRTLAALLLLGDLLTPDISIAMYRRMRITPTGITMFEHGDHGWRLMTWNDYAHLGEDTTESFYK